MPGGKFNGKAQPLQKMLSTVIDGREIGCSVLFVDLPVIRKRMKIAPRGDPVHVHAGIPEKIEEILVKSPGVDVAAAEFEGGHPDGPFFEHAPGAQQKIHLVSLDIGLEQVDVLHAMIGAVVVHSVDHDLLRTGKRDAKMVQLPLA